MNFRKVNWQLFKSLSPVCNFQFMKSPWNWIGFYHNSFVISPGCYISWLDVNDLNQAIKFCKVHHFADYTNLLCLGNSIKKLNKLVNADLKRLVNWLNANKISLNVKKTEIVIFKSKQKKFEGDLKIELNGKRLYSTGNVKYLGMKFDTNLSWQYLLMIFLLNWTESILSFSKWENIVVKY